MHKYGIAEEDSDIRAHVSDAVAFVFQTAIIKRLVSENKYKEKVAYQKGYNKPTARGLLVPITSVPNLRKIPFASWARVGEYNKTMSTTEKGEWAVSLVIDLLKCGRFPIWIKAEQTQDRTVDIQGTDILLFMGRKIQVKCDYPAKATGNLYIQTHEINPLKQY